MFKESKEVSFTLQVALRSGRGRESDVWAAVCGCKKACGHGLACAHAVWTGVMSGAGKGTERQKDPESELSWFEAKNFFELF